jgi:transposase InsO family protein
MRQLTGFEYLHVIVDDYSRLAYAEVLDNLTAACAIAFLRRAVAWYAARGVTIRSVMSDNGSCYTAHFYSDALRRLGLKHLRIKPGRPRTNGCEIRERFRLGPLPGSRRCCSRVTRPNGWLGSMPLLELSARAGWRRSGARSLA